MTLIHGTCVDLGGFAVLLRGPSGSGKSDLALRLIDAGGRLVSDDQVSLELRDGAIVATAPPQIAGLLEVRGLGLLPVPAAESGRLGLVVDLVAPEAVERLPEPASVELAGGRVPLLQFPAFHTSTCAKIRLAARALAAGSPERS